MERIFRSTAIVLLLATLNTHLVNVRAQGTAFTYQGRLSSNGSPASGTYDLAFTLYTANTAGAALAGPVTNVAVAVTNGLFTTLVDFEPGVFTGTSNWLAVAVSTNGANSFSTLAPRQQVTPTPYALFATTASNVSGTVSAAQISGAVASANISGTYGNPLTLNNAGNTFIGTFAGSGANLTTLNANNLASGTVADTRLSTNVALLNANQIFSGVSRFKFPNSNTGAIYVGAAVDGGDPKLIHFGDLQPSGLGYVYLGENGEDDRLEFRAGKFYFNNGSVGIGKTNPATALDVNGTVTAASFSGDGSGLTNVTALAIPQGMTLIPAGSFTMGDTFEATVDSTPLTVTVSAFYMDVNLVSFSQWKSVYYWATNHGYGFVHVGAGKAANHPVQTVDWYDCVKWCNARSQQAGRTPVYYTDAGLTQIYTSGEISPYMNLAANGYRLPTEAEWEKAARGGLSMQRFPWGNTIDESLANYDGNTVFGYDLGPNGYNTAFTNGMAPYTSSLGYFAPNGYGLYDVAGNVSEWCWDWYGSTYGQPSATNPTGPATGSYRVLRGGDWFDIVDYTKCARRNDSIPITANNYDGFRCVRGH